MRLSRRVPRDLLPLCLILALGAALRLFDLAKQSMWSDEIGTLLVAAMPFKGMLGTVILHDLHPPLFYLFAHFWQYLGHGETIARLPSALGGLGAVGGVWYFARRRFGGGAALTAALLLALWPAHVYYSGEFRPTSLTVLCAVLSFGFFPEAVQGPGPKRRAYWLATAAGLYLDYSFLPLAAVQGAAAWIWRRRDANVSLRPVARLLVIFAPGLAILAMQIAQRNYAIKLLGATRGSAWLTWLATWTGGGATQRPPTYLSSFDAVFQADPTAFRLISLLLAAPLLALLVNGIRTARRTRHGRIVIAWALTPPAALLAGSLWAPYPEGKLLAASLPAAAMLLGLGVAEARRPIQARAALVWIMALFSLAIWQQKTDPRYQRDDWRGLARETAAEMREGDVVLGATFELQFYYPGELPQLPLLAKSPQEFLADPDGQTAAETEAHLETILAGARRVWFQPATVDAPGHKGLRIAHDAEEWLNRHWYEITPRGIMERGRPRLRLYVAGREEYAAATAPELPTRADFGRTAADAACLRGFWLPTDAGWAWTTNASSVWLRRPENARSVEAEVYVNMKTISGRALKVRLLVEGETVAEALIETSDRYRLAGELPPRARAAAAVEVAIRTDEIIDQDKGSAVPPERARTVLVRVIGFRD